MNNEIKGHTSKRSTLKGSTWVLPFSVDYPLMKKCFVFIVAIDKSEVSTHLFDILRHSNE